ncbi:unnamed protein product [Dovyalis caffra]|uniref:Uncharacterized protein n=1 Tax=Dovyalis caffra TaxID=77055 RepID=A0AAV1ST57_9ROSI|nr:unnamed protein product [Dovyalis caffra]
MMILRWDDNFGLAYIHCIFLELAARALDELDKSVFQSRFVRVMSPKQKDPSNKQETNGLLNQGSTTLKRRRHDERRAADVTGGMRAWSNLFFQNDRVGMNSEGKEDWKILTGHPQDRFESKAEFFSIGNA